MGCRCFDAGDFQTTDYGSAAVDHDVSEWALSELGFMGLRVGCWVPWLSERRRWVVADTRHRSGRGCSSLNGDSMGVRCVGGAAANTSGGVPRESVGCLWGKCAFCTLGYRELLDAAHIIPDSELRGEPVVSNGIRCVGCTMRRVGFGRMILGVRPDYIIRVQADVLEEVDGPMLRHGLQGLQGQRIVVPSRVGERPDVGRLGVRWGRFLDGV